MGDKKTDEESRVVGHVQGSRSDSDKTIFEAVVNVEYDEKSHGVNTVRRRSIMSSKLRFPPRQLFRLV